MAADNPEIPNVRISAHDPAADVLVEGFEDRDNFVRNLVTALLPGRVSGVVVVPGAGRQSPLSRSAAGRDAILSLDKIKVHLRIELNQNAEDDYLTDLEMAARLHTENVLRREIDDSVGQNITRAMLLLIAHWYRNRETVAATDLAKMPNAYEALLSPERDFDGMY